MHRAIPTGASLCVDKGNHQSYNFLTGLPEPAFLHRPQPPVPAGSLPNRGRHNAGAKPDLTQQCALTNLFGARAAGLLLAGMVFTFMTGCQEPAARPSLTIVGEAEGLSGNLTVFAAASLTQAFTQMGQAFESAHPGASVSINFDGSQRLRTQLEHGAQADVFAAADWEQMNALVAAGLIAGEPAAFAANQLVFLAHSGSHAETGSQGAPTLASLAQPGRKIVLALPEAPAGRYSRKVISQMEQSPRFGRKFAQGLLNNVVSEEPNVRSVARKVALGEADAGLTYQTDALIPSIAPKVQTLALPDHLNVTAQYPIGALQDAAEPELARAFVTFVRGEQGQAILRRFGFRAVE